MSNLKIFEGHFKYGMYNKNFGSFKRYYPTLLKCILKAMDEVESKTTDKTLLEFLEYQDNIDVEVYDTMSNKDLIEGFKKSR